MGQEDFDKVIDDANVNSDSEDDEKDVESDDADLPNDDFQSGENEDDNEGEDDIDEDEDASDENSESEDAVDNESEKESGEENDEEGNAGWADAMAKVLAMGKNSDKPVSVLSKAKKDNVNKKKQSEDKEQDDSEDEENVTEKKFEPLAVRKAKKKQVDSIGRSIPNVLDRNSEKVLSRIATKGVVQLFNAVREHQKDVKIKLKDAGGSFRKQEKVYKNLDKSSFVQMLTGKPVNKSHSSEPVAKKSKIEVKDEDDEDEKQSSWNILRNDYMLGAKMKDWDKDSDEDY